jgi:hypothetical protein
MTKGVKVNGLLGETVNSFIALSDVMDAINALDKLSCSIANVDDELVEDVNDATEIIESIRERVAAVMTDSVAKVNDKLNK